MKKCEEKDELSSFYPIGESFISHFMDKFWKRLDLIRRFLPENMSEDFNFSDYGKLKETEN